MITFFDDLPDLALIELLSYLTCVDAVLGLNNLNSRLTAILFERGYYCHVNLSSMRRHQFQSILSFFQFSQIESLVIDYYGSPLQLRRWPCLQNLRILIVRGVRELRDVYKFAKKHVKTLTHLTAESSEYSSTCGIARRNCYPVWNFCDSVQNILRYLPNLQVLDFGRNASFFLHYWPLQTIQAQLTYLRITITTVFDLVRLMNTEPLSHTLQQLHIKMNDSRYKKLSVCLPEAHLWPRMNALHTFTFIKSFNWHFIEEWTVIDKLTSSNMMPMLRRMKFCLVIDCNDLQSMYHSELFTDDGHVKIHYAFMINDNQEHIELYDYVQRHSQSQRRQIASATFISECWHHNPLIRTYGLNYVSFFEQINKSTAFILHTLPYMFDEFVQLCLPDRCVSNLQVFTSSRANYSGSSRLTKLNMSDNLPSFVAFLPHIVSPNRITELYLFKCDQRMSVNLPTSISRLTLTDSLDSLKNCSLLTNIRSVQVTLNQKSIDLASVDWTSFRTLSSLPLLKSLRVLLYDMDVSPDDRSCQIIAATASMVADFSFCFRYRHFARDYDIETTHTKHSLFIEQLRNRILALPLDQKPFIIVEKDGYGLIVWF